METGLMQNQARKILVLGAGGMLGTAICAELAKSNAVIGFSRSSKIANGLLRQVDILNFKKLSAAIDEIKPDSIINAASCVFVNQCEEDREGTYQLHVALSEYLAQKSSDIGAHLTYISTDSVFAGDENKLHKEVDKKGPRNYYAKTKLDGEDATRGFNRSLVLRTNIFGWRTDRNLSFGEWVLSGLQKGERRTMFTDVRYTPISTMHLARVVGLAIESDLTGTFHAGGRTWLSKYEFAKNVARLTKLSDRWLTPTTLDEMPIGADRPKNTGLDSSSLSTTLKVELPTIEQSILEWLENRPPSVIL